MKKIFTLIFVCTLSLSWALFTPAEKEHFERLLQKYGEDLGSVDFFKDWGGETYYKIPKVVECLNKPFRFALFADSLKRDNLNEEQRISYFSHVLFSAKLEVDTLKYRHYLQEKVHNEKTLFDYVEYLYGNCLPLYERAWQKVSEKEKKQLEYFAYCLFAEEEDSLAYNAFFAANGLEKAETAPDSIKVIIDKIDFCVYAQAWGEFFAGTSALERFLRTKPTKKRREKNTSYGKFIIGSTGDDTYREPATFIYDPAGNDTYTQTMRNSFKNPFLIIYDAEGNDVYTCSEIGGLFFALCGMIYVTDFAGDDYYHGSDFSLAAFGGAISFHDNAGDDFYKTGLYSLSAASFGCSFFDDDGGNDIYWGTEYTQGFASTLGASFLTDKAGNDLYYAGGKYLHVPLAPFDFRSMGQGFAFGLRPEWGGGIAVLLDKRGNDNYVGGVYAQGGGYYYGMGMLFDLQGNDNYHAVYYPQGSGIHLALGLLDDEEGDDRYFSKNGPGQGAGHDYGVGVFVDRKGDDTYSIPGGNGMGLSNSVGIFLDAAGDDCYERLSQTNFGFANSARGMGGIGLFLDTGGKDVYADSLARDNTVWQRGWLGVGQDSSFVSFVPKKVEEVSRQETAKIDSTLSVRELFSIACEWEVGSAVERVKKARELLRKQPEETAAYIYREQLKSKSGLTYRAIIDFAKNCPDAFMPYYERAFVSEDSLIVKAGISLAADLADSSKIDVLRNFLQQHRYENLVISVLGSFKLKNVLADLLPYLNSSDEKRRIIAVRAVKQIPGSETVLAGKKGDASFLIRSLLRD